MTAMPMHNSRSMILPNGCDKGHFGPNFTPPSVGGSCTGCSSASELGIGGSAAGEGELKPHWELPRDTMTRNTVLSSFKTVLIIRREWRIEVLSTLPLITLNLYTKSSKPNEGTLELATTNRCESFPAFSSGSSRN